ncbi:MAG: hypothetical protein HQ518_30795 [Rhodopirellula sp.]|nr:hypothetical protein [Rhodopirellula sp.]
MSDLRPELQSVLAQLRGRIRRYVFLEGAALILAVLGSLFWLSLAVDHAWFQISRLELPRWFRAGFDVVVVGLVAFLLLSWIGLRLLRSYRTRALALVLERRFPELDDRLVTAVELAESGFSDQGKLTIAMAGRTIDDAVKATRQLDLASVFDRRPLQRAVIAAVVAVASIGGLAVASNSTLRTWKDSFVDLNAEYWRRETGLIIRVIAQPGDIIREFNNQSYKHARGADLTLQIDVEEGRKAPERVQLKYRLANGRGQGTVLCSRVGDNTFRHSLAALLDDVEFYVYGGDFVNRVPYRVQIVEPPQLEQVELSCFYPSYTRMRNPESTAEKPLRDLVPVRGTQVELPNETEFLLKATCNKPLTHVRMQFGSYELTFAASEEGEARLVHRSEEDEVLENRRIPPEEFGKWISEDGTQVSVPFVMTSYETDAARLRADSLMTEVGKPFVLAPDSSLRIYLEDLDGILTAEPSRLQIGGIVDESPVVETSLRGIGTSITRKASIPVLGRLVDDYGLATAQFEYQVDETGVTSVRPFENSLTPHRDGSTRREFELKRSAGEVFERFEVLPLDLSLGQKLVLSVVATDEDNLNGPHRSRGERYAFKVVSNEELQSVLYQRELNLRAQFERVITETKQTQQDLILHRSRLDAKKRLLADKEETEAADKAKRIREIELAVTACAERSLHAVRKNANETASVELSFRDIREELVNNGLHTPQTLERIDDRIVKPLGLINTTDFPVVDEALGVFRLTNERGNDATEAIDNSVEMLRGMISRMERILAEMEKLKEFQKAVEELKLILEQQRELLERTKKERKKKLLLESLQ